MLRGWEGWTDHPEFLNEMILFPFFMFHRIADALYSYVAMWTQLEFCSCHLFVGRQVTCIVLFENLLSVELLYHCRMPCPYDAYFKKKKQTNKPNQNRTEAPKSNTLSLEVYPRLFDIDMTDKDYWLSS